MPGVRATAEGLELGAVFELSPNSYMIVDRELRFVAANGAYLRETGTTLEQLLGRHLFDAFPHDPIDRENESARQLRESFQRVVERRQPDSLAHIVYRVPLGPGGRLVERRWSATNVPIFDLRGEVAWILQHTVDVSDLRQGLPSLPAELLEGGLLRRAREVQDAFRSADAERRETAKALHRAQKMEAVGQLTGGVAHDFNNLLQVISGNLDLLSRELAGNERALRRVQVAAEAVQRGAKLAAQLLAFARRQPLEQTVVDLGKRLLGVEELIQRAVGAAITVEKRIAPDLWRALVDANQLENVLLNLAINARDAMGGSGRLTVELDNLLIGADDPLWPEAPPGQYVLLSVSDTGAGMPPEVAERAFEPFFTTKPEGCGTGLGLSVIYGFVKQSGGHVQLDSAEGRGTTVRIVLPRCAHEETAEPRAAAPLRSGGGNETVLVVDDDDAVRSTTAELLEQLGYRVVQAQEAERALRLVEGGERIDLLLSDVIMPGALPARELARRAVELQPHLQVLFVSGFTDNEIDPGGLLEPGVHLLRKPWSRDDLARRIRQLLGEPAGS